MAGQEPIEPPPVPLAAPPTRAGAIPIEPPRSTWPTVLGIIAIVLAVLGLLSLLGQAVMLVVPHPPAASQPAYPEPPAVVKAIVTPMWAALSVLLLVGGIGVANRRRWSARALVGWAIGDVVLTLVGLGGTLMSMPAVQQQMSQQNAGMPPGFGGVFMVGLMVAMCFGAAFGLVPPVFALVWFGRRKIKDEVAGWV
jgi:hypothetical protein